MRTRIVEATNGFNWGKFLVAQFDEEWATRTAIPAEQQFESEYGEEMPLLSRCGWSYEHRVILDLQTGEGAVFRPGGYAKADLEKHKIWVCPLFEPFLEWVYTQDLTDVTTLPRMVELPNALSAMQGYRREGK